MIAKPSGICDAGVKASLLCLILALFFSVICSAPSMASAAPLSAASYKKLRVALAKDRLLLLAATRLGACKGNLKISNPNCDADKDRLINKRERRVHTDKMKKDTDGDGLSDRDELVKYHTDPAAADSDGDTLSDGSEIQHGSNPLDPNDPPNLKGCKPPNFDADGNTSQFGIPAGLLGNQAAGSTEYAQKCRTCHIAAEKAVNYPFTQLKTALMGTPMFFKDLSDLYIANLVAYLNRSQPGGQGCDTPAPILPTPIPGAAPTATPFPTPTATPFGNVCSCSGTTFDANCNTVAYEIPAPLSGNLDMGESSYTNLGCYGCHTLRGQNFTFTQLKAAVTGPKMNIQTVTNQQFADMAAWLNISSAHKTCSTPMTPTPTPTRTPTPTQTATPAPTLGDGSNAFFDCAGNTKSGQFSIPSGLVGNINTGASLFSLSCSGCHGERGTGFSFTSLKSAVTGPLMNITTVSDQNFAHLTAWLNRAAAPAACAGTPVPTPTPLSDFAKGQLVFQTTCQTCHKHPSELRRQSASDIREAINEVRQMNGITLSSEQLRVLVIYLAGV